MTAAAAGARPGCGCATPQRPTTTPDAGRAPTTALESRHTSCARAPDVGDHEALAHARSVIAALARRVLLPTSMWTYAIVDGDVASYFALADATLSRLGERYLLPAALVELRIIAGAWRVRTEAALVELTPWGRAGDAARRSAHQAYVHTLALRRALAAGAHPRRRAAVAVVVSALDDLLEEWRPYLGVADVALRLSLLGGASVHDALAVARSIDRGELVHFAALRRPRALELPPGRAA
ncbi:MAG: hypothetical protein R2939_01645 [Kofleriaceae bacterium]